MTNEIMNDSNKHCINVHICFCNYLIITMMTVILLIINLGEKPSWLAKRGEVV